MSKPVICDHCHTIIKSKDELVTSVSLFEVLAYHEHCYIKELKGVQAFYVSRTPINGFSYNLSVGISIIFAIGWGLFADGQTKWLAFLVIFPIYFRLYSYFVYERHLAK
ncbi:hypothetical protein DES38_104158 [Streptohalobacillus salinus]|uniref:Permease n=1 Tax=Streptohalobacillus salinus TaxID=621096 RepID=A0A2V3WHD4_9BACI|nr:hypothetical protein [Streptohalobacillus salinus]PXW91725.1 hypothetical protein DES38_104158 [Streptohalobacillus salinus]